jgi:hypothetical protein
MTSPALGSPFRVQKGSEVKILVKTQLNQNAS